MLGNNSKRRRKLSPSPEPATKSAVKKSDSSKPWEPPEPLHVVTPLMYSNVLSAKVGCHVWLKCENLQPSGSFKIRGLGKMCQRAVLEKKCTNLVNSSTGNAALAVAYAGRQLDAKVTCFVPKSTPKYVIEKLNIEGAQVMVQGETIDQTENLAVEYCRKLTNAAFIPSFDHDDIVSGHSSIIDELSSQLPKKPKAIICPVGGGGLLSGILAGLTKPEWKDVNVISVETHLSNTLQQSILAGEPVHMANPTSVATSLVSTRCTKKLLDLCKNNPVIPFSVSDAMAADACRKFADDHKLLVEPSTGAVLSVVYTSIIKDLVSDLDPNAHVVCIVCGGSLVTLDDLDVWKQKYKDPPTIVKSGAAICLKFPEIPELPPPRPPKFSSSSPHKKEDQED
ncbi:tryptophan synthase beta subunit-like PLP-dependent enzyme [Paraphysoderma sedebokerense]|nr:tryptophan synthase beta subunit-like PLP-dependent enzyme [Paraphysoderma sedebokerense]